MKTNFGQLGLSVRKHASWNVIVTLAFLVMTTTLLVIYASPEKYHDDLHLKFQWVHVAISVLGLVIAFLARKKWTINLALALFILIYGPYYFLTWHQHVIYITHSLAFSPFTAIKLHFFALAFLVPGPFWVNLLLMIIFGIEAIVMWTHFDIPNLQMVILGFEPTSTMLFGIVSLFLLFFRYRDEKIIRELSIKHAEAEAYEKVAKIFLNIRDRTNTPIQTLKIATFILSKRLPPDDEMISIMEKSIAKLTDLNEILNQTESHVRWHGPEMLSDQEVLNLVNELDGDKNTRSDDSN
ncbi:hypothetical protein [Peredibacter starrii]|uniref:Uncharacterized protein n=1 Tax=Peredibacter starrii TaxID=28202 RepID=A0AAX4HPD4_9BACT|nr:hypothetical protein [Peredibacter starrii]WPU64983.1 hypothetical protein SOO65_20005 [Peredibacter starrii]